MNILHRELDIFMEIFPSMSYDEILALPYYAYRDLMDVRGKRKSAENDKAKKEQDDQRRKAERESKFGIKNYK